MKKRRGWYEDAVGKMTMILVERAFCSHGGEKGASCSMY